MFDKIKDVFKINDYKEQIDSLSRANAELVNKIDSLDGESYFSIQGKVNELNNCYDQRYSEARNLSSHIRSQYEQTQELDKQIVIGQKSLMRMKELYYGMKHSIENYIRTPLSYKDCIISDKYIEECEKYNPIIRPELETMNENDIYQAYIEKQQLIDSLFEQYSINYNTPADKSVYQLVSISLKAEIENISYNLKPNQLEAAIDLIQKMCQRTLKIACDANTSLAGSYTKLIGELEYHYSELVHLRYEYLVKINFPKSGEAYR